MARGGKIGHKRKTKNRVQLAKNGSDESDEDYKVDEDEEFDVSEDDYCSSLAEDESEESLVDFEEEEEEEEEEWVEGKVKKAAWPRGQKGSKTRMKNGVLEQRKKYVVYSEEEEGEDYDAYYFSNATKQKKNKASHKEEDYDSEALCRQEGDEFVHEKPRKRSRVSRTERCGNSYNENPEKDTVSYGKEEEDVDYDDSDDEDDEEFTPGEVLKRTIRKPNKKRVLRRKNRSHKEEEDYDSEALFRQKDDECVHEKPRKRCRVTRTEIYENSYNENPREKDEVSYIKEEDDVDHDEPDDEDDEEFNPSEVLKRTRRNSIEKRVLRRKNRSDLSKELTDEKPTSRKKKMIGGWGWGRRRKSNANSDSDFVSSSDYEYTVSEEEREQIREAAEFSKSLTTSTRNSSSLKMIEEEELLPSKRKRPGRKGKQKVLDVKVEVGKQVCGICLSEEGKRTVKGVLNCCSHHFCFACIMEWSKVESRCPLCKQRFATISRTVRTDGENEFRDAVFPVPERDQVYQPSEEELRGYLDPYENVLCTECQQGGDDAFMLLCDLCDSPAHTYCVGLGNEVPDGNWYCEGCRPTALASSNAHPQNPIPDNVASNNWTTVGSSPVVAAVREIFDLNEAYVPDTPQSPRHANGGHFQTTTPASGPVASTLHSRRQMHRLVYDRSQQFSMSEGVNPAPGNSLFNSPIGQDLVIATQNTVPRARTASQNIYFQGRLVDRNTPSLYSGEFFSSRLINHASTSTDHSFGGPSPRELAGFNAMIGGSLDHQQLHPCSSSSNTGADASISAYQFREREATVPSRTLQGHLHMPF